MTSTLLLTSSAANSEIRSRCSEYWRQSIMRFWPSMKPNRRSSSNIATVGGEARRPADKPTDAIGPPGFLGQCCERPRHRRTTDKRNEIAPPHGLPFNEPEHTLAHR